MRFRILGPMEIEGSAGPGVSYTPRAAKLRVVLGALLVRSGEVVSVEALTDELWQDDPPRTATTTLQVYISQLRKQLNTAQDGFGREALVTRQPGYVLSLEPDRLDLARFEALHASGRQALEAGDFARASALQRQATDLWRGPLLSDTPHGPALEAAAVRLEEAGVAALEQRVRADLELGRHRDLIAELQSVTTRYPLREEFHGHLMLALFRAGRQAEALRAFGQLRRTLVEELAIEPGPALQQLHRRILEGDAGLLVDEAAPSGAVTVSQARGRPVALPAADPAFTGREDELARVVHLLRSSPAGTCVAVAGMPGVGKTALAVEAAHRCADAFPDGRLFVDLEPEPGRPLTAAQALTRLLRRAGENGPLPEGVEDLRDTLHTFLAGRRLLLVLDHAGSEAQLRPLLPTGEGCRALITMRRTPASLTAVRTVSLAPLPSEAACALLATVSGRGPGGGAEEARQSIAAAADPEVAAALLEVAGLCGRLPLALRSAAAQLAARPHWTPQTLAARLRDARDRLDALRVGELDVRDVLLTGCAAATAEQQRSFRLLALLPDAPVELRPAAAVLGLGTDAAGRVVEGLVDARLLEADDSGSYRFHPLLRLLAAELLARHEPEDSTRDAAGRLAEAYANTVASTGPSATTAAGTHTDTGSGLAVLVGVLRTAHAHGAWQAALRLADSLSGGLESHAAWHFWRTAHTLGLDAARRSRDRAGEARMLRSLGDLAWQQRELARSEELYEAAVRAARGCANDHEHGRALVGLADVRLDAGAYVEAGALLDTALGSLPDRSPARFDALRAGALLALDLGDEATARARFTACRDLATSLRDRRLEAYARRCLRRLADMPREPEPAVEVRPGVWRLREAA
ncbi:AfsR/SARP family transcriptional regulator [Streptomyces sp. HUAS TT20]|uniref:AfsR/SARP family transcriptional regulator n=1 Tax=Streptomyces sp. HUAS TT20 TaxID=3447509 RepID=UPI0021DA7FA6|nr:BTAD domain-containing putative transcriptional regulator [Streptomyces sp. HUAS 15-9]UXY30522.1 winged helix-turn-helix domain-containing protein [Streptomyces sp. HUAS 15-9]